MAGILTEGRCDAAASLIQGTELASAAARKGSIAATAPQVMPLAVRGKRADSYPGEFDPAVTIVVDGVRQASDPGLRLEIAEAARVVSSVGAAAGATQRSDRVAGGLGGLVDVSLDATPAGRTRAGLTYTDLGGLRARASTRFALRPGGSTLSLWASHTDAPGPDRNLATGDRVEGLRQEVAGARLILGANAADTLTLAAGWTWSRGPAPAPRILDVQQGGYFLAANLRTLAGPIRLPQDMGDVAQDHAPHLEARKLQAALTYDHRQGDWHLRSHTTWLRNRIDHDEDGDASPVDLLVLGRGVRHNALGEEFRVGREDGAGNGWSLSGAALWQRQELADMVAWSPLLLALERATFGIAGSPAGADRISARTRTERTTLSAGAALDRAPGPGLRLHAWARWIKAVQSVTLDQSSFTPRPTLFDYPEIAGYRDRRRDHGLEFGGQLAWQAWPGVELTLAGSRAMRPGGFAQGITRGMPTGSGALGYDAEKVSSFEVGAEWTGAPRLQARARLYAQAWENRRILQGAVAQQLDAFRLINCGDVRNLGIEGSLAWHPLDRLAILMAADANAAKVTTARLTSLPQGAGLRETPIWNARFQLLALQPIPRLPASFSVQVTATGPFDLVHTPAGPLREKTRVMIDAGIEVPIARGTSLRIAVRNVTDTGRVIAADQSLAQVPWLGLIKRYGSGETRSFALSLAWES